MQEGNIYWMGSSNVHLVIWWILQFYELPQSEHFITASLSSKEFDCWPRQFLKEVNYRTNRIKQNMVLNIRLGEYGGGVGTVNSTMILKWIYIWQLSFLLYWIQNRNSYMRLKGINWHIWVCNAGIINWSKCSFPLQMPLLWFLFGH